MDYSIYDSLYSDYDISAYARTTPDIVDTVPVDDVLNTVASVVGTAIGVIIGLMLIISLVIWIIKIVANWKIFIKAGEKGWKAIIPFYNTAILYKISGMSPWLVLLYLGMLVPVINIFIAIAFSVFKLYQPINLAKGFKKSTGFTVGMIMLPFIFNLILGFGKSEYYGFDESKPVETVEAKAE